MVLRRIRRGRVAYGRPHALARSLDGLRRTAEAGILAYRSRSQRGRGPTDLQLRDSAGFAPDFPCSMRPPDYRSAAHISTMFLFGWGQPNRSDLPLSNRQVSP
jgi:hypothetical protein